MVEKRVNKAFVSVDDLKEAFLDVVTAFQENRYYSRKSKTPAPIKESFQLSNGHFSIALFPDSKTILARDVLSTKEKSGENVVMYMLDNNSVLKKIFKGYKDSHGHIISESVGNQTWLMDTKTGEFNLLG